MDGGKRDGRWVDMKMGGGEEKEGRGGGGRGEEKKGVRGGGCCQVQRESTFIIQCYSYCYNFQLSHFNILNQLDFFIYTISVEFSNSEAEISNHLKRLKFRGVGPIYHNLKPNGLKYHNLKCWPQISLHNTTSSSVYLFFTENAISFSVYLFFYLLKRYLRVCYFFLYNLLKT